MSRIRAGLIGFGYWGPNLYRNIQQSPHFQLTAIIDSDIKKLEKIKGEKPELIFQSELDDQILEEVDAVFIATPASTHFELANRLLKLKKHVWIEKPVSSSYSEIQTLAAEADKNDVIAVADHTYAFAPSVVYLEEMINQGKIGEVLYVHSVRSNLGIFQPDVSVIWDLAVHDLSILSQIIPCAEWESISCSVGNPLNSPTDSIADITLKTRKNQYLSIHVNWLSPIKIRQMVIGGTEASVIFDDLEMFEKIKITKQSFKVSSENDRKIAAVSYSLGESVIPRLDSTEPLTSGIKNFANSILHGTNNKNSLINVVSIYRALDRAQESSKIGGREIRL